MEMPANVDLQRFAFLWDGSEPGWVVAEHGESRVRMTVVFAPGKPTLAHLATLRGLVPELARRPVAGLWKAFRSMDAWPSASCARRCGKACPW